MTESLVNLAWSVGGFVLLVGAAAYLLLPLMVKFTQHQRLGSGYELVGREHLPPDVLAFMDRAVWELQSLGFVPAVLVREVGAVPDVTIYVVLLPSPSTFDRCALAFTVGHGGTANLRTPTVTFETKFEDGSTVETGNFADAGVFPPDPNVTRLNIPNLDDVRLQYEIHRRRRAKYARPGARAVLPPPGHELASQVHEEAQEKERVRAAGYYYLDAVAGKYRPTWKGAYLMTWKLLFPVGALRRQAKRVKARRELGELGMDRRLLDASPPRPPFAPFPAPAAGPAPAPITPPMPQRPIT